MFYSCAKCKGTLLQQVRDMVERVDYLLCNRCMHIVRKDKADTISGGENNDYSK